LFLPKCCVIGVVAIAVVIAVAVAVVIVIVVVDEKRRSDSNIFN